MRVAAHAEALAAAARDPTARVRTGFPGSGCGPRALARGLPSRTVEGRRTAATKPNAGADKEHAMMFALVLALIGFAIIPALNLSASH